MNSRALSATFAAVRQSLHPGLVEGHGKGENGGNPARHVVIRERTTSVQNGQKSLGNRADLHDPLSSLAMLLRKTHA
jgi:hypothetical protein